jgi:hypothetical protein
MECPICFSNSFILYTKCSHPVCLDCHNILKKTKEQTCPICRQDYEIDKTNISHFQREQSIGDVIRNKPIYHKYSKQIYKIISKLKHKFINVDIEEEEDRYMNYKSIYIIKRFWYGGVYTIHGKYHFKSDLKKRREYLSSDRFYIVNKLYEEGLNLFMKKRIIKIRGQNFISFAYTKNDRYFRFN